MKIDTVYCFFEQSGTFQNAFLRYGVSALSFDIRDDFGETTVQMDLFREEELKKQGGAK